MKIHIMKGLGSGPTKLSAFDSALNDAGVANYNLVRLSSVIPPKTEIILHNSDRISELPGEWGDKLYVVMADARVDRPNAEAWAGVGWVQDANTGQGLFVEHEASSEKAVRRDIEQSLNALMATRNIDYGQIHMEVIGKTCMTQPVCSLVIALYQVSSWENKHFFIG